MTPEEIRNESMTVLKGKEIQEVDQKLEKDMIELTILEAAENIEKYQKETKTWNDRKVLRKDINVVWTSLGPLPQWVLGTTTRWATGTTRLVLHGT
jgi:hypothetical protein